MAYLHRHSPGSPEPPSTRVHRRPHSKKPTTSKPANSHSTAPRPGKGVQHTSVHVSCTEPIRDGCTVGVQTEATAPGETGPPSSSPSTRMSASAAPEGFPTAAQHPGKGPTLGLGPSEGLRRRGRLRVPPAAAFAADVGVLGLLEADAARPALAPVAPRHWTRTLQAALLSWRRGCTRTLTWYLACLDHRPVLTKCVTSAVMHILGDVLAQLITGVPVFDVARCLRFASYAFLISAPANHFWHQLLDAHVHPDQPKATSAVLMKLSCDQLLFTPLFTIIFYSYMRLLEGRPDLLLPTLQHKFFSTLLAKWCFWPFVNLINFRYIPNKLRVLFLNVFGIVWSCYISMIVNTH